MLNIGGISNLSLLRADGSQLGFDCGPGNGLMDLWCERHQGKEFDEGGAWAAGGEVDRPLLNALLADPYFRKRPPKSTGRDLFNAQWLDRALGNATGVGPVEDVQATLAALTARTLADAVRTHCEGAQELLVCGGGARNTDLMLGKTATITYDIVIVEGDRVPDPA